MCNIEEIIKAWIDEQKEKYPNSVYKENLESVEFHMFNHFFETDNLITFLKERYRNE